jgi:hypothetical protein
MEVRFSSSAHGGNPYGRKPAVENENGPNGVGRKQFNKHDESQLFKENICSITPIMRISKGAGRHYDKNIGIWRTHAYVRIPYGERERIAFAFPSARTDRKTDKGKDTIVNRKGNDGNESG